jgi:hypothetical protein
MCVLGAQYMPMIAQHTFQLRALLNQGMNANFAHIQKSV